MQAFGNHVAKLLGKHVRVPSVLGGSLDAQRPFHVLLVLTEVMLTNVNAVNNRLFLKQNGLPMLYRAHTQ